MARDEIDLAYRVLDLDLVDSEGRRCGKADDIEIAGDPGETAYVAAIRSGPGALARRMPRRLRGLGDRLFGEGSTSIPWREVSEVGPGTVELDRTAADLGLGEGDRAVLAALRRLSS
jgi:hypothetical protein